MSENVKLNADRFLGFADIYSNSRPKSPEKVKEILLNYLGRNPLLVIDLGCGTGLSTAIWSDVSRRVIGIEPSMDMQRIAKEKLADLGNVKFISAFSNDTGLDNNCADIITCSQSFHWMNPQQTLKEVSRLLTKGGVFAVYDYDWPPVCNWEAELAYSLLLEKVTEIESNHPNIKDSFVRWNKDKHLTNIKNSQEFRYVREIVFSNYENCNAHRLIELALSQGGLQAILKRDKDEINSYLIRFQEKILEIYGNTEFNIDFCYRLRIGIK
ncbi:ubiquinone/menaquinone biosynthesis C-methyltransferase UbiE [Desulfosporosinus acididurans]|uniref:Ubiquinone/menaquinone biosynthesis C-methyltransferase UbiE n=1 Tax=Desulfosporosinus acididurans TaxID=476652 RepID=A0A0J1FQV6_9FIRM|nr:class I SAM-dependent methyltransferase [Desulfosporosinus acididurans]KLU65363.1 ubiquinone/menaquinone biosynthesis C-methyltransferase UbiE [Desulfosporosinus acididurans]